MAIYDIKNSEIRSNTRVWNSNEYIIWDDPENEDGFCPYTNRLTIVIRDGDCCVSRHDKTWRVPLSEAYALMNILDGHFETVKESIVRYGDMNRDEIARKGKENECKGALSSLSERMCKSRKGK